MEKSSSQAVLMRAHQHQKQELPGNPMTYEVVSPEDARSLAMYRVVGTPGQTTGSTPLQHSGDENLLVLSGSVEVDVEGKLHILDSGDSLFIPRGQRHLLKVVGTEPTEAVFVLCPPGYRAR